MAYVFDHGGDSAQKPHRYEIIVGGKLDKKTGARVGGEVAFVLEFTRPTTDQMWDVEAYMVPVDLKLARFRQASKRYVLTVGDEVPALELTRGDVEPLVGWLVDRIVGLEGLEDSEGAPQTVERLGREGLSALLFRMGFDEIIAFNDAVRATAGLSPAVGNDSGATSRSTTQEDASAPSARAGLPSEGLSADTPP